MAKQKGFGSKIGFILASAGSAVGLGNLWRFPWLVTKYGGGAFLFTYIIMVALLGIVVMIAEMLIGRIGRDDVITSYGKVNRWFKWMGMLALAVPFIIACYYTVIGGWSLDYTLKYIVDPSFVGTSVATSKSYFVSFITSKSLAPILSIIFMIITIVVVAAGVEKGIEKASKILLPILFVLVIVLAIWSLTFSGAKQGMKEYFGTFVFQKEGPDGYNYGQVILAAMSQAFFSLSLGMGALVAFSSYSGKKVNLLKTTSQVVILDTFVAIFAGIIIYPAIYSFGSSALTNTAGPGLLFVVMPAMFANMPGGHFFGLLFFILIVFAALTSLISLLEVVTQYVVSKGKLTRKKATWLYGLIIAILSVFISISFNGTYSVKGATLLDFFDGVASTILLPTIGLCSLITIGWGRKKKELFEIIKESDSDFKGKNIWLVFVRFIDPILIVLILIFGIIGQFKNTADFPNGSFGLAVAFAVILIVITVVVNILINNEKFMNYYREKKANNLLTKKDSGLDEE